MFRRLRYFFREAGYFAIPPRRRLPKCRIRPFAAEDISACEEIYRLNEPCHFPAGYADEFSEWLAGGRSTVLLCEVDGGIVGLGGIRLQRQDGVEFARLSYGMIHPAHHQRGYGTALLLARLAALPEPDAAWNAFIMTNGSADSFYERFGFIHVGPSVDERGTKFFTYHTRVTRRDWKDCRHALAPVSLDMADATVRVQELP
jgi:ribosomal protein S18 acetylase RimI-like enzyme